MLASPTHKPPKEEPPFLYVDNPERELVAPEWAGTPRKGGKKPGVYHDKERGLTVFVPDVVKIERNLRDDPLGQMHDRGQITTVQYRAGRIVQRDHELAEGHIAVMDTTKEPVDGSRQIRAGITDTQMQARDRLKQWQGTLDGNGWRLCKAVLIDKRPLREACQVVYLHVSKAKLTYAGHRFRETLDTLAKRMGLVS